MLRLTPSFDIGDSTAHKISMLANIAFDIKSPYKNMHIEGIDSIESMDIDYASELVIKSNILQRRDRMILKLSAKFILLW